jgi:DNA-binding NtrC family response regulator
MKKKKSRKTSRSKSSAGHVDRGARKSTKVMVVDDDRYVLDLLSEFLSDEGYDVSTAESGETAIERQESAPVDIALIDFRLPGIDGLETIRRIGRISANTVTIIMTGFPTLDSSIAALRLGASDYIVKPFKLEEVSSSMKKAEDKRRIRREMLQLQQRVAELEKNINEKKDTIKVHKDLIAGAGLQGRFVSPAGPDQSGRVEQDTGR